MTATGQCLCGAVNYVAEGVDTEVHSCHCKMCRRWGGGPAFAVSVDQVKFEGEENITRYSSSEGAERGFCIHCGTNLFYRIKDIDHYMMWMGAFNDEASFNLAGEIYIENKPELYSFTGDHPRWTGEEFLASLQQGE